MAASRNRRRTRETNRTLAEEWANLQRGFLLAQVEGVAALTDAARRFLVEAMENEPLTNRKTWGDVVRDLPDMMDPATAAAEDELANVPRRMVDTFYREYGGRGGGTARERSPGGSAGVTSAGGRAANPEAEIIWSARDYLEQVPGSGALLATLVNNVALDTGYPRDTVEATILRHFVSNGMIVRKQSRGGPAPRQNQVLSSMAKHLTDLGYTDLRYDYPLRAFPDMNQSAALVALEGGVPVILCYPAGEGQAGDPAVREAARFQAAAVAPGKAARNVWVSDGTYDYFFDSEQDRAIPALPRSAALNSAP